MKIEDESPTAAEAGHRLGRQLESGVADTASPRIGTAELALLLVQVWFLFLTRIAQNPVYVDDAYIHFRNADNFARGLGLLYNPGERLIGTTSPFYAMVLGVLLRLTGASAPGAALVFNFLCDCGIALVAASWMRRAGVQIILRHAVLFSMSAEPMRMYHSAAGMELSFFTFMSILAMDQAQRGRLVSAGLALGPLGWIRPEGIVVWAAVAGAHIVLRKRRELLRIFAVACGIAIVWTLGSLAYYGTIIPQSLIVKSLAPWYLDFGGICHVHFFIFLGDLLPFYPINGFQASWGNLSDRSLSLLVATGQVALMGLAANRMRIRRMGIAGLSALLFLVGYYCFYALSNPQIFPWYWPPYFCMALLLGGVGWQAVAELAVSRIPSASPAGVRAQRVVRGGFALLLAWLVVAAATHRARLSNYFEGSTWRETASFRLRPKHPLERELLYVNAATLMNSWIDGDASIRTGCVEIGVFGYYYRGRIMDSYGLVSPEAVRVLEGVTPEEAHKRFPVNVFMQERPEYIMSSNMWILPALPGFAEAYTELNWPVEGTRIFVRSDLPLPPGMTVRPPA